MSDAEQSAETTEQDLEIYDCVTILEANENVERFDTDLQEGERLFVGGGKRNLNKYDEEEGDFIRYAEEVAVVDLNQTIAEDELSEWASTEIGGHVLSHYFDHTGVPEGSRFAEPEVEM